MSLVARGLGRTASVLVTAGLGRLRALLFGLLTGATSRARVHGSSVPASLARDRATERALAESGSVTAATVADGGNEQSRTA